MATSLPDPDKLVRSTPRAAQGIVTFRDAVPGSISEFGKSVHGLGEAAEVYRIREKDRMDNVALSDAKNKYLNEKLKLESEYSQILGGDAVNQDLVTSYSEKLDLANEGIVSQFTNQDQARRWKEFYNIDSVNFKSGIVKHKLTESDRYAANTHKSTIALQTQKGQLKYNDSKELESSAAEITRSTLAEAQRTGKSAEQIEAELIANLGPLWAGAAYQALQNKEYEYAKELLEAHEDVIGTEAKVKFLATIKEKEELDQVLSDVSNFFEGNPEPSNNEIIKHFSDKYPDRKDLRDDAIVEARAHKTAQDQEITEIEQDARQEAAGMLLNDTLEEDFIVNSEMSNTDKVIFSNALLNKRTKGNKYITNLPIRANLKRRANTDPHNLSDSEIWAVVYTEKGITDKEAQEIQVRRDEKIKALASAPGTKSKNKSLARAHAAIDDIQADRLLDEDVSRNAIAYAELHEALDDHIEANQDADPVAFVKERVIEPVQENAVLKYLKDFSANIGKTIIESTILSPLLPSIEKAPLSVDKAKKEQAAENFVNNVTGNKVTPSITKITADTVTIEDGRTFPIVDGMVTIDKQTYKVK